MYASGFAQPRLMALAPGGDVALSDMKVGRVYILRGSAAGTKSLYASGLNLPHGLAFHGGFLYVATQGAALRYPYRSGDTSASGSLAIGVHVQEMTCLEYAPEPPSAWHLERARSRLTFRLPPQTNGVGWQFQPRAVASAEP